MLLGLGSPFAQQRVDFNLLHGTDTSSGTHPFTSPANLNDGNGATGAARAADPHATAYIVQSVSKNGTGAGPAAVDLGAAVTAGSLLVIGATKATLDASHVSAGGAARPFTEFTPSPVFPLVGVDDLHLAWRIATGDEQHLSVLAADCLIEYWEIALQAASPGTYITSSATLQAPSNVKALAALSVAGAVQLMVYARANGPGGGGVDLGNTVAAGWTQDAQIGKPDPFGHQFDPAFLAAHATTGPTPSISGGAEGGNPRLPNWAGLAVGIPTGAADETSICEADLGAAYPVDRITLLEAVASGVQYTISYWNGAAWVTLSPSFAAVGAQQTYVLAATVSARYWRIADNHSPAVALGALTWGTWTIEGFPL